MSNFNIWWYIGIIMLWHYYTLNLRRKPCLSIIIYLLWLVRLQKSNCEMLKFLSAVFSYIDWVCLIRLHLRNPRFPSGSVFYTPGCSTKRIFLVGQGISVNEKISRGVLLVALGSHSCPLIGVCGIRKSKTSKISFPWNQSALNELN